MTDSKIELSTTISEKGQIAVDFLASETGLPKGRIKDAMTKGAVTLTVGNKTKRLRRVKAILNVGDKISIHYDPTLLSIKPELPSLIADEKQYTVWYKPAGILSQGSPFGDHCALIRMVEQLLNRPVFLVHRLDREATGLMMVAHSGKAAAALSKCFQDNTLEKHYWIKVKGILPAQDSYNDPIDGKTAISTFTRKTIDDKSNTSTALVKITQGRKHQIRRHFDQHNFPVIGDPRYGKNNKSAEGMQLCAYRLAFKCPLSHRQRDYSLPKELSPV